VLNGASFPKELLVGLKKNKKKGDAANLPKKIFGFKKKIESKNSWESLHFHEKNYSTNPIS